VGQQGTARLGGKSGLIRMPTSGMQDRSAIDFTSLDDSIVLYRAADPNECYTGIGACYAQKRQDAKEYVCGDFRHHIIYCIRLAEGSLVMRFGSVSETWEKLVAIFGRGYLIDQDYRVGGPYPHEVIEHHRNRVASMGVTHIEYEDRVPRDCPGYTIQRVAPGCDIVLQRGC
jgi:hypothetical protein